ncbi:MAG: acyl-CoA dehydrogenase [Ramlibacter sp.]|nr:acyl-CoA dehydrogenase [Ramlibacter sp.]
MKNPDRDLVERAMQSPLPLAVATSAFAVELAAQILQAAPGDIRLGFTAGERFTQATGALQGGAVAAMLDFGLAFAALSRLKEGESAATLSLTIDFLRPALPGPYEVQARVVRGGRRVTYAQANLLLPTGELVATATSPLWNG